MSRPKANSTAAIAAAARWLKQQKPALPRAVPVLRERFELTAIEACEAIGLARNLDIRRAAK